MNLKSSIIAILMALAVGYVSYAVGFTDGKHEAIKDVQKELKQACVAWYTVKPPKGVGHIVACRPSPIFGA